MIPYGRQDISESDISAVVEVLRSDFLTQGPAVPKFEACILEKTGAGFCTAFNSATSALHASCLALEVGPGDILWTSPNSFVASANCALYCGASVDFVDIDYFTRNMSLDALEAKLETAEKNNKLPKVLVVVHFSGMPCAMQRIKTLSEKYNFSIVEDASHAVGAEYNNEPVGNCRYSDITVFSFHPVKIITTGEGGVATTNDKQLAEKLSLFRSHGITRDPEKLNYPDKGPWYYEQLMLGFNYRMTDMHAALGISQLQKLDGFIQIREKIRKRYDQKLSKLPLTLPKDLENCKSAWHLYVVNFLGDDAENLRARAFNEMRRRNIGVNVHYIPIHLQPYYVQLGFKPGDFPNAENYYKTAISIPIFPSLSNHDQDFVISALHDVSL